MRTSPRGERRPWAVWLARRYTHYKAARALDGVRATGLAAAKARAAEGPLVIAANHVSFWDAFVMVLLDEALGTDGYVLMDKRSLDRLPFMGALGALPLDRSSRETAEADLAAAAALLDRPGRAVWIYPQGRQRPHHVRPLGYRRGVERLARASGAAVLPLALAYPFGDPPQPEAHARFGTPLDPKAPDLAAHIEAETASLLDAVDAAFLAGAPPERLLSRARGKSPEGGLGARLLGARRRP